MLRKLIAFAAVAALLIPCSYASAGSFVEKHVPEYAENYLRLKDYLESGKMDDTINIEHLYGVSTDDTFLMDTAYPSLQLKLRLDPEKDVSLKPGSMRWMILTTEGKLVSIRPEEDGSFYCLGMQVPADTTRNPSVAVNLDTVEKQTAHLTDPSFTFVNANQYHMTMVLVYSSEGDYMIPFTGSEEWLGLKSGEMLPLKEAITAIDKKNPQILTGENAYNENGEPLDGGGGVQGSSKSGESSGMALLFFIGAGVLLCIVYPVSLAIRAKKHG